MLFSAIWLVSAKTLVVDVERHRAEKMASDDVRMSRVTEWQVDHDYEHATGKKHETTHPICIISLISPCCICTT
jgi:hypothetical protein